MESWYKVSLSEDDISNGKDLLLRDTFETLFAVNHAPADAALFTTNREGVAYPYFFSPGAARIASSLIARYGGVKCSPPAAADVMLLVGNAGLNAIPFANKRI
jgi:hypothetical protein